VPNFGLDHEIVTSETHTKDAETDLGVVMQASFKAPKGGPTDYFVPNFGA